MKLNFDVTRAEYQIIKDILVTHLPSPCKVWVFGSRAKYKTRTGSDIDLALEAHDKIDKRIIYNLKEAFTESRLPYRVDIVDMKNIDDSFKQIVQGQLVTFPIQSHNTPRLRFPEFTDPWQEKKLGEVFSFKNGINASKEQYGFGYKFINVLDIIQNNVIKDNNIIGSVDISEAEFEKNNVIYGDILFQRSSETRNEVGQSNVYIGDIPVTFGGFVIRGRGISEYNPLFFHYMLKTEKIRDEITQRSGGSTRFNIGQESLSVVPIKTPSLTEQQKIAGVLGAVDEKIALLNKEYALMQDYKKGMMQKLFSGCLRFTDENGHPFPEWQEKKLGDVATINKGEQLNKDTLESYGDYPVQNGGILPSGYTDSYNTNENTIVISEGGNSCGFVSFMTTKFWCGGHCYALKSPQIHNKYLFFYLKNIQDLIMSLRVGSGLPNIQKKDMNIISISFPSLPEQQKIADYLSSIDEKISVLKQKINQTTQFKKSLLQQMFV